MLRILSLSLVILCAIGLTVGFTAAQDRSPSLQEEVKQVRDAILRTGGSTGYIKQHAKKRLAAWQAAAKKGSGEALWFVARCYDIGVGGLAQDLKKSANLMRQSADKGFALGQNGYANMLEDGDGLPQDHKAALKWYRKAADQDEPVALFNLGRLSDNAKGYKADEKEAIKWYEKAAAKKYVMVFYRLAELAEGGGDAKGGLSWYRQGSDAGDQLCTARLLLRVQRGLAKDEGERKRLQGKLKEQAGSDAEDYLLVVDMLEGAVGKKAPNATGTIGAKKFQLIDHAGKVVVLHFSATWCRHCKDMAPQLKDMVKRLDGKPFVLLDVDTDKNSALADRWGVTTVPTTYVIDGKGIIRNLGSRGKDLDKVVDRLVAREKPLKK